jgi:uncharacterized protein (TIGR03437 family)
MRALAYLWPTIFAAVSGHAQILSGAPSSQTASPGQTVIVSLSLDSQGQGMAGVQFDVNWDPPLAIRVVAGDQVRSAAKNLYTSSPSASVLRCLIVGVNQTTLPGGELLKLLVSSDVAASGGVAAQIRISNALATAPDASPIALSTTPVNVQLQGSGGPLSFPVEAILNAAGWSNGAISPGEVISLAGGLPAGSSVFINGVAAPVLYTGPDQLNAAVPFGLDLNRAATIQIVSPDRTFSPATIPVAAVSPAIFTLGGAGLGPGAILNQDDSANSFEHPAAPGSAVTIYGTGFGLLDPAASDGQLASGPAATVLPVTATIDGIPTEVIYAGAAPGILYGVVQVNVVIPAGAANNLAAPVSLTIDGATTPSGVSIAIQRQ